MYATFLSEYLLSRRDKKECLESEVNNSQHKYSMCILILYSHCPSIILSFKYIHVNNILTHFDVLGRDVSPRPIHAGRRLEV